jgi:hypothetical protein
MTHADIARDLYRAFGQRDVDAILGPVAFVPSAPDEPALSN